MNRLSFSNWQDWTRIVGSCPDADIIPRVENAGEVLLEDGIEYQVMHNGLKVVRTGYANGQLTQMLWTMRGVHEPQEEKCFYECLKDVPEGATMIELGSNWAFYSMWFYLQIKNAKCHCIELDRKSLELGIQHFEKNNARAIFTHAGFGKPDLSPWHTYQTGNYIRTLPTGQIFWDRPHPIEGFHLNVPMITIDQYIDDNQIEYVNILHSDIQGEELVMLRGAARALKEQRIGFIFISTHSEELHKNCIEHLESVDYKIIAEHSMADSYSGDGLIVAKSHGCVGPEAISISKRTRDGSI